MTKAEEIIKKVVFGTFTTAEIKESPKTIRIYDIDKEYGDFAVEQSYHDCGEIFYFYVSLFLIEYDGSLVPLAGMSNIGGNPDEVIEELATVMERTKKEK